MSTNTMAADLSSYWVKSGRRGGGGGAQATAALPPYGIDVVYPASRAPHALR